MKSENITPMLPGMGSYTRPSALGTSTDDIEMECEMGVCPINFDRENRECSGCRHNKVRKKR
jgi:hypothetical protein